MTDNITLYESTDTDNNPIFFHRQVDAIKHHENIGTTIMKVSFVKKPLRALCAALLNGDVVFEGEMFKEGLVVAPSGDTVEVDCGTNEDLCEDSSITFSQDRIEEIVNS